MHAYLPGQLILGKFGGRFLEHLDDRTMVTIAGARAGKTSTVLEPNLYLYPGSMLILNPKAELAKTARRRRLLGHDVHILDPFGEESACFNPLDEIDPASPTVVDDVATITQALIIDDGDAKAKHWNDSARALLLGADSADPDAAASLLQQPGIQAFVGTAPYLAHKARRFRSADNPTIRQNDAFRLVDAATRALYAKAYAQTSALYHGAKPTFDEILAEIGRWAERL